MELFLLLLLLFLLLLLLDERARYARRGLLRLEEERPERGHERGRRVREEPGQVDLHFSRVGGLYDESGGR